MDAPSHRPSWKTRAIGIARWIVRRLARVYYPDIEISGREHLPPAGPVLLAANHQNSLLDPVLLGFAADRPVRFLAKAPLFEIPLFGHLLHALGMLPAYRRNDDPSQSHRNFETLERAAQCLARQEAVGIFPEGRSHDAPRLETVKSGAARIALQAVQAGATGVQLVPVGLNYERKEQFRSAVWIRIGRPIDVNAWRADWTGDERAAVRALSAELDERLRALVLHLDDPAWEPMLGELESLLPPPRECRRNPFAWLRQRHRLAAAMNHYMRGDHERATNAAAQIRLSHSHLAAAGLSARSPILRRRGPRLAFRLLGEAILMDVGFVVVLIGTLHHLLPFAVTRLLASRLQATGRSTVALSRYGLGLPIYAAWYGLNAWWIASYFLPWVAWAWLVPMPFAGLLALHYWRRVRRTSPGWWRQFFLFAQPARLRALRAEHDGLRALLEAMDREFESVRPREPLPRNTFSWRRFGWSAARWTALGIAGFLAVAWVRTQWREGRIAELAAPAPSWRDTPVESATATIAADEQTLLGAIDSLRRLEATAAQLQAGFLSGRRDFHSQADNDAIRQAMLAYLACRTTLLQLTWKYQRHEEIAEERLRWRGFLVQTAAASAIADASLRLVNRFGPHPDSVRKLNEADAAWGLPPGLFDLARRNLLQADARSFLDQALAAHAAARDRFQRLDLVQPGPYATFHEVITRHARSRDELLPLVVGQTVAEPLREAGRMTRGVAYQGQAFVSTWLGSTRFRRPRDGQRMISPAQLQEFRSRLQPGDILLERQNWFLSRAFMPGYWAHAALYVGTTNDLVRLGLHRDPRVAPHWKQFAARNRQGHELLILEAVPEGVRMTTLEHCIGVADAAAALRPRVDEAARREAIARAFSHLGKAYDFDFDFFTSDRLVCTELVHRSYDGALRLPLVEVMGRRTLPPTELARTFATERGRTNAQLDCVVFLDGDERRGAAAFATIDAFAQTIERPGLMLTP